MNLSESLRRTSRVFLSPVIACAVMVSTSAFAEDVIHVRKLSSDLAVDIAAAAVKHCRESGYQVTAVVVDRGGNEQVVIRDTQASRFTIQIARDKANTVVLSGVASADLRRNRADIRPELNHVDGLLVMEGGLPITGAGSLLGAVGVSGAPGGDKDAICAQQALDDVQERLEFID